MFYFYLKIFNFVVWTSQHWRILSINTLTNQIRAMANVESKRRTTERKMPFWWIESIFMTASAFPRRLADILQNEDPSIIGWNEDGKSFKINDTEAFTHDILPRYFRHSKLASFQRQLNIYGFHRLSSGPSAGSYHHTMFSRDKMDSIDSIKACLPLSPYFL